MYKDFHPRHVALREGTVQPNFHTCTCTIFVYEGFRATEAVGGLYLSLVFPYSTLPSCPPRKEGLTSCLDFEFLDFEYCCWAWTILVARTHLGLFLAKPTETSPPRGSYGGVKTQCLESPCVCFSAPLACDRVRNPRLESARAEPRKRPRMPENPAQGASTRRLLRGFRANPGPF